MTLSDVQLVVDAATPKYGMMYTASSRETKVTAITSRSVAFGSGTASIADSLKGLPGKWQ